MDNAEAIRKIFETEDTLRKRLALLETMRKVKGRQYWKEKGYKIFPNLDVALRRAVFNEERK